MSSYNYTYIHEQKYSAGILPFTIMNDTIYFLLGKDKYEKSWADFGGKMERMDNNNKIATASREFQEETLGIIAQRDYITHILNDYAEENIIHSKTLNGSPYYMYIIQIPYCKSYRTQFIKAVDALSFITHNNHKISKNVEKCDLRWTSIHTIRACLNEKTTNDKTDISNDGRVIKLRNVYYNTMQNNMKEIERVIKRIGVRLS